LTRDDSNHVYVQPIIVVVLDHCWLFFCKTVVEICKRILNNQDNGWISYIIGLRAQLNFIL